MTKSSFSRIAGSVSERTLMRSTVASIIIAVAICSSLRAEVVFSNLGPNDTFSSAIGYSIGGQYIAGRFTVGPQNYLLTSAEAPLSYDFGDDNLFPFHVRTDDDGLPGALLASASVSVINPYPPTLANVDFSSSSLLLLAGTTYWLTAEPEISSTGGWWANSVGETGNFASTGGTWISYPDESSVAFRINGTAIPEPSSILLAALTFIGATAQAAFRIVRRGAIEST